MFLQKPFGFLKLAVGFLKLAVGFLKPPIRFDPAFLKAVGGRGGLAHVLFLVLVVVNMVAAMQALGTLMAVGLMMLPAASARMWTISIGRMIGLAILLAAAASIAGLLITTEAMVADKPEPKGAGGGMPDMGGMGGMGGMM